MCGRTESIIMLSNFELALILNMQKALNSGSFEDGYYSVYAYSSSGELTYHDGDTHSMKYVRDKARGDYVTNGVCVDNVYTGKREIVWAAKVADTELSESAATTNLPEVLAAGECFMVVFNAGTELSPKWTAKEVLQIPPNHVGMVGKSTEHQPGHVTIVPQLRKIK